MVEKNKSLLPISIIIGCVILGGFFYAIQIQKQKSIEKQQQIELQAKKEEQRATVDRENIIKSQKSACVAEAQRNAIDLYKTSSLCTSMYAPNNCNDGSTYLVAQYDNYYETCLERKGLK